MRNVILIGDSIRMGYEPVVREALDDGTPGAAEVWGSAENGGTSANVLAHLDEWVISRDADVVHLNCGLHDLRRERGAAGCAAPLDRYRANVEEIMRRIAGGTRSKLVWATTTPVNEKRHNAVKGFDRFGLDVAAYNRAALDAALEFDVEVNDLFEFVTAKGRDGLLADDGVHFTNAGYRLLGEEVARVVRAALGA